MILDGVTWGWCKEESVNDVKIQHDTLTANLSGRQTRRNAKPSHQEDAMSEPWINCAFKCQPFTHLAGNQIIEGVVVR